MMNLGILGAGFSGKAISRCFADEGINVWGTTRREENLESLKSAGMEPILFNDKNLKDKFSTLTHLVVSIAPNADGDIAFDFLSTISAFPKLEWICYLSTVGVYGNHDGEWVDEEIPVSPVSERSKLRVKAELTWQDWCKKMDIPLSIFRLSGIYGVGRNALCNAESGKARRLIKAGQVFNRIHNVDIAQATWLAAQDNIDGIFNITDDEPCPPQDVVVYAHKLLGLELPPELNFETADISPMARSFYGENKRVSNKKSKDILHLTYAYPNYRVSLDQMFESKDW